MTTQEKNIEIAKMLGAVREEWYPSNKDTGSTGIYFAMPQKQYFPNGERYCGDTFLKFDTDANWQFEAIDWVEKQGYPVTVCQEYCQIDTNFQPYNEIIGYEGKNKKEAIFEALFQFSQYLKQKK